MRTIDANLKQDIINGKRSNIIKLTCKDGTVYGYTDHDMPLVVSGTTYTPAPALKRIILTSSINDTVSNQEFGSAWVDAPETDLLAGKFDNALVELAMCSWENPQYGKIIVDIGRLGVVQWTADGFRADMHSSMREMQKNINFVFTPTCRHLLFSQFDTQHIGACTLNKGSYTYTGTVSLITSAVRFNCTGLSQPQNWCTNGILEWTSGNNTGRKHEVKKHEVAASTTIELFLAPGRPIELGNTFTITAGCDKTLNTCKTKFNNVINFGGFPHIQTEVQYR